MNYTSMADLAGAVEVSEDRGATSLALAGWVGDELRVDLVDVLPGAGGAVGRIDELTGRYSVATWAVDPASPAGSLLLPLSAVGVTTAQPSARDVAGCCGRFLDMARDGEIRAGRSAPLRESVRQAQARRLAGGTAFDRRTAEVGPMMAAALAVWACVNYAGLGPDQVYVGGCEPDPAPVGAGDLSAVMNWPGVRTPPPLPPLPP